MGARTIRQGGGEHNNKGCWLRTSIAEGDTNKKEFSVQYTFKGRPTNLGTNDHNNTHCRKGVLDTWGHVWSANDVVMWLERRE